MAGSGVYLLKPSTKHSAAMKRILPLLAVCLLTSAATPTIVYHLPTLQFRLVVDSPTADSEPMTVVAANPHSTRPEVLNVQKTVLLDQSAVKHATASKDALGQSIVNVELTADGAKRFAAVTRDNVGKRLAIIIEGQLYSAPVIQTEITSGHAQISGAFTPQQAQDLAARLNGQPVGGEPPAGRTAFCVLAVLFVMVLAVATWVATRRGRAPNVA
jgi:preprotein translocase subunit SecD